MHSSRTLHSMNSPEDLFLACTIGDLSWLRACVEQDTLNPVLLRDKNGLTCLHLAALNSRPSCVEYLIEQGLSPGELTEKTGDNALHFVVARKSGHRGLQSLKLLLSSLSLYPENSFLNQQNNMGQTPLHRAMSTGYISYIKLLIRANARPDIRDGQDNLPIDVAKIEGHYEAMRLLQSHQWSLEKNRNQHFILVSKNRELLQSQHKTRADLESRRELSRNAFLAWGEKKSIALPQENRLYPESGPQSPVLDRPVNLAIRREIAISLNQKKHNLTLYKHTQPLPAPLVIRATSALTRHKLWLPEVATRSVPSTRHHIRNDINSVLTPVSRERISVTLPLTANQPTRTAESNKTRENVRNSISQAKTRSNLDIQDTAVKERNEKERELLVAKLPRKVPIRIQNFIFPDTQPDLPYENQDSP